MYRGDITRGFTLIEMLVVLAIIAIVITLSTPLSNLYRHNRVTTQVHDFISALNVARNEAVSRGVSVSICIPVTPAQNNVTTCAEGVTTWENGWVVFIDRDADCVIDANVDPNLDDTIIHQRNPLANGFTFHANNSCIRYNEQGTTPTTNGLWTLAGSSGDVSLIRAINISVSGRLEIQECQTNQNIPGCPSTETEG